jgi:hypothetical protein
VFEFQVIVYNGVIGNYDGIINNDIGKDSIELLIILL